MVDGAKRDELTDGTRGEDVSGHDSDLASSSSGRGSDDTGAVGSDETRFRLATEGLGNLSGVSEHK